MQLQQLSLALLTVASVYCADEAWNRFKPEDPLRMRCLKNPSDSICRDIETFFEIARKAGVEQKAIIPAHSKSTEERLAALPENRYMNEVMSSVAEKIQAIISKAPSHKREAIAQSIQPILASIQPVLMELFAQQATSDDASCDALLARLNTSFAATSALATTEQFIQVLQQLAAQAEQEQRQRTQQPRGGAKGGFSLKGF